LATITRVGVESPLIHHEQTLLGLSLLVTGRDSGLWVVRDTDGLGVRDIRLVNKSLLARWQWKLLLEE